MDFSSQKYEELKHLHLDSIVKEWYDGYVSTHKMLIGLSKCTLKEEEARIKRCEYELVNYYGDNVDEIYEKYKFSF